MRKLAITTAAALTALAAVCVPVAALAQTSAGGAGTLF